MKIKDLYLVIVLVLHMVVFFCAMAEAYFGKFYPIYAITSTLPPEGE